MSVSPTECEADFAERVRSAVFIMCYLERDVSLKVLPENIDRVQGIILVTPLPEDGPGSYELGSLIVRDDCRRKGLATLLVNQATLSALSRFGGNIALFGRVHPKNAASLRIMARLDWRPFEMPAFAASRPELWFLAP